MLLFFSNRKAILTSILALVVNKKVNITKTSFSTLMTKGTYWHSSFSDCSFSKLSILNFFKAYFYFCYSCLYLMY